MTNFLFNNSLKFRVFRHLLFFLVTLFVFAFILYSRNADSDFIDAFKSTFLSSIFFFVYAYLTIFLLIPEFLLQKRLWWFILFFLISGVALSSLKLIVSDQMFYSAISPENISQKGMVNLKYIIVNAKDMTFIVALFCVAKYVKDYIYVNRNRKELESQTRAAQQKLFQSQFDPHFLFNTINNLYALSMFKPQKTEEVLYRIKIVLNYIIQEIQRDFVSLLDEISLVENYILLEKLRYGERLKVDYHTSGNITSGKIPPMILFFLVENCFKHGSSLDAGTPWIKINVNTDFGNTKIIVANSKPANQNMRLQQLNTDVHLPDLEKRLNTIYQANGYNLKIENKDKTFKVELELREDIDIQRNKYR